MMMMITTMKVCQSQLRMTLASQTNLKARSMATDGTIAQIDLLAGNLVDGTILKT